MEEFKVGFGKSVGFISDSHKCPQCGFEAVKRKSVGVWVCKKCGFTFAGGAYIPFTKIGTVARRAATSAMSSIESMRPPLTEETEDEK